MSNENWSNTPNTTPNNGNNFFVDNNTVEDDEKKGNGCGSWAIYVGILLLINLLSWIFDWSFWVY